MVLPSMRWVERLFGCRGVRLLRIAAPQIAVRTNRLSLEKCYAINWRRIATRDTFDRIARFYSTPAVTRTLGYLGPGEFEERASSACRGQKNVPQASVYRRSVGWTRVEGRWAHADDFQRQRQS